jgi:hypothetical protein
MIRVILGCVFCGTLGGLMAAGALWFGEHWDDWTDE